MINFKIHTIIKSLLTIFLFNTAYSQSLNFDGVNDKVSINNTSDLISGDYSISIWFKTTNGLNSNSFDMILDYSSGSEFLEFFLDGGGGCGACATGSFVGAVNESGSNSTSNYTTNSTARVDNNAWHHAVMTRVKSSGAIQTYINGSLYDIRFVNDSE